MQYVKSEPTLVITYVQQINTAIVQEKKIPTTDDNRDMCSAHIYTYTYVIV